jgi:hypothetical protein
MNPHASLHPPLLHTLVEERVGVRRPSFSMGVHGEGASILSGVEMRLLGEFALGWASMSQQEQKAALSEYRFTRDYLDGEKISYL